MGKRENFDDSSAQPRLKKRAKEEQKWKKYIKDPPPKQNSTHTPTIAEDNLTTIPPSDDIPDEIPNEQQHSHDIEPRIAPPTFSKSTTSGLPQYLANPIKISANFAPTEESKITNPQYHISKKLIKKLEHNGISHLFPVQKELLPRLNVNRNNRGSSESETNTPSLLHTGDILISAPTGSGKTLSYILPILNAIQTRTRPLLRALIILPTKDLSKQVYNEIQKLKEPEIKAILLNSGKSFKQEQDIMYGKQHNDVAIEGEKETLVCRVDIVVTTAGRLVEHLEKTVGFTLEHLKFLVIDEADRLLSQKYQDWISTILKRLPVKTQHPFSVLQNEEDETKKFDGKLYSYFEDCRFGGMVDFIPLRKLLFSATLTRNPEKLNQLKLESPIFFTVGKNSSDDSESVEDLLGDGDAKYIIPSTLSETMLICPTVVEKPLTLISLLYQNYLCDKGGIIIFTKSVENAHRLSMLLNIFDRLWRQKNGKETNDDDDGEESDEDDTIKNLFSAAISSDISAAAKSNLIASFLDAKLKILTCSDLFSRGIDLPATISTVINYDTPMRVKTYIHRIGRTARAGNSGDSYCIVEQKEVRWVKNEVLGKCKRSGKVKKVEEKVNEEFVEVYEMALKRLEMEVKGKKSEIEEVGGAVSESEEEESEDESESDDIDESEDDESGEEVEIEVKIGGAEVTKIDFRSELSKLANVSSRMLFPERKSNYQMGFKWEV
ncbi:ATP-dependent RNA helicase dbp6 [Nowakowskiella sp. JEL0407]|nr:ATP-dependent RNA helicase dbp6 [Nowakowskiella sp. JEL0407]